MKKKKNLIIVAIVIMISLIGVTYAFFQYYGIGTNQKITAGDIYLTLNEGEDTISLVNVFPETPEEARSRTDNQITFSVSGINTTIDEDIYYEIMLNEGDDKEGMNRFDAEDLVFDLIEIGADGNEYMVVNATSFKNLNKTRIWINSISHDNPASVSITYKLRMWLSEDVLISESDPNADYTVDEFENSYGSAKVTVYGDLIEKSIPIIGYINYDMSSVGIENPESTPIYQNGATLTYAVNKNNLEGFIGWSTTTDATQAEYKANAFVNVKDITSNNMTLYPVIGAEEKLLNEVIVEKLTLTDADSDGTRFVTGDTTINNYVTYSGILWRIVAVNSDGSVKIITQDNQSTGAWGGSVYNTSSMHTWLSDTFLPTLENSDTYLKIAKWDYTTDSTADTNKPSTTSYVEEKIGLLTNYECMMAGVGADSYLNNSNYWWTMTLSYYQQQGPGWYGWIVNSSGSLASGPVLYQTNGGYRPSVVLVPEILVGDVDGNGGVGEGTADSPYEIKLP